MTEGSATGLVEPGKWREEPVHLRGRLSQFASTNRQNTTNMMMMTVLISMVFS